MSSPVNKGKKAQTLLYSFSFKRTLLLINLNLPELTHSPTLPILYGLSHCFAPSLPCPTLFLFFLFIQSNKDSFFHTHCVTSINQSITTDRQLPMISPYLNYWTCLSLPWPCIPWFDKEKENPPSSRGAPCLLRPSLLSLQLVKVACLAPFFYSPACNCKKDACSAACLPSLTALPMYSDNGLDWTLL